MTEFQTRSQIANYLDYKEQFEQHTSDIQEILEACGWKWVKKDISEYSESRRYQDWLVSPEMYASLQVSPYDSEMMLEPDSSWVENVDYILF
jgi:hypothetical protein